MSARAGGRGSRRVSRQNASGRGSGRPARLNGSNPDRKRLPSPRDLNDEAEPTGRYRARRERNFELPRPVVEELKAVSDGRTAVELERRLVNAAQAYERDRYKDALQALKPVLVAAPDSAAARELHGLILYRLGRWRQAEKELRAVHEMTGSFDQYPVIADCARALGRLEEVTRLWDEMRKEGADKEVLVEGRLVMAGALADADRLEEAISLLEPAARARRKNADVPLIREWYALADLYERAGDLPRARELFRRVALQAPDMLDAVSRLRAIR